MLPCLAKKESTLNLKGLGKMAVLQLLSHGRNKTYLFHKLCCISQKWNATSYNLQCLGTDDVRKRQYSGLSISRTKLQLQKYQNSPLYMANSKRHIEYNIFYLLVHALEYQYVYAHNIFGFEWWATIILCTMPYRVTLAYYMKKKAVEQKYKAQDIFDNKLAVLEKKEIKKLKFGVHKHLGEKEKKKMYKSAMKAHQKRIWKEEKYSPWAYFLIYLSPLPFWLANSWALRNLSGAKLPFMENVDMLCPEMQIGGILWFPNLCEADPYHILPVLTSLSFLMAIELNSLSKRNYGQKDSLEPLPFRMVGYLMRGWCVFVVYIFWNCPAAMTWFWCVSGFLALFTRLGLSHPDIERRLVPTNQHHEIDEHPYRTILKNMNKRYNPRNWFLN